MVAAAALAFGVIGYMYLTLPDVRQLAAKNPTTTAFMKIREKDAARAGRPRRHLQQWVRYSRISKNLQRAVLVAEDSRFFEHEGVDLEEIRKSIEINMERGAAVRGASTITQQLAKNLYLSPSKDPLRKIRELIIARRMEAALSKARILEIYMNVIEWGDGIWGAEAAARYYFGVPASALTREQAALLAAAIINPRVHNPAHPDRRLIARRALILARMGSVEPPVPPPPVHAPQLEPPAEIDSSSDSSVPTEELPSSEELSPTPTVPPVEPVN